MKCKHLDIEKATRRGRRFGISGYTVKFKCKICGHYFSLSEKYLNKGGPSILVFDFETAPMIGPIWEVNKPIVVRHKQIIHDSFFLSYAVSWLDEDKIISDVLTVEEVEEANDRRLVKDIYGYLNEADIIIGYNSDRFDIKKVNWKFLEYDMIPFPAPSKSIDLMKVLRKYAAPSSYSLDYVDSKLGSGGKEGNRPGLWDDCIAPLVYKRYDYDKAESSLQEMRTYNEYDVIKQKALYLFKLRPIIENHPNVGLYFKDDKHRCKACGSIKLAHDGTRRTNVRSYLGYICNDCGHRGSFLIQVERKKKLAR